jgi:NAD(P)H-hydrate epimerase
MRILTAESMSQVDRVAIEDYGIPSLVLMENAALGLVDAVAESYPEARSVSIFCGPGNNGGDGLALARHLSIRGYHVEVTLATGGKQLGGDAAVQLDICQAQGLKIREIEKDEGVQVFAEMARRTDLVVDALFGIGLGRPLEGQFADLVQALNALSVPRLAVDLPSGLRGSRAEVPGPHLEADLTVTFGAPKIAHIFPPSANAVGDVVVADLGIPTAIVDRAEGHLHLLTGDELASDLVPRAEASHKGDFGHLVSLAGSTGKAGAAILAARAAVRSGTGLVTAAVPEPIVQTVDLGSLESMSLPLPLDTSQGLDESCVDLLLDFLVDKDALAVGPGLGLAVSTVEVVKRLVSGVALPVVLDADGLNAFAGDLESLAARTAGTVLTPHPGELARLLGTETRQVQDQRVESAREAAERSGAVVVLKGHRSLIASPSGEVFVNPTGNAGMASGGMGDVLTGVVAGLVAQSYEPLVAALLGTFIHGLAGDIAVRQGRGLIALAASDLLETLADAFAELSDE